MVPAGYCKSSTSRGEAKELQLDSQLLAQCHKQGTDLRDVKVLF